MRSRLMWRKSHKSETVVQAIENGGLKPDQPHPGAPGVADLDTVGHGHDLATGLAQPLFVRGEQIRLLDLKRKPRKPRRLVVAASGAGALPDVEAEMMMVAAGGEESRALAFARRIEADGATVEAVRLRQVADAQMHVADAHAIRRLGIIADFRVRK